MNKNKEHPKYQKLIVEKVIDAGLGGIEIYFSNFGITFSFPERTVKKYGLENLSSGDTIFAKSKTGDEKADFVGANTIQDIYFQKS